MRKVKEMAFNPNDHMSKLKGKDYLEVKWRLVWFREEHPDFCIDTQALTITDDHAVFKAVITGPDGTQVCAGHGSESKRDFGDFIEKAETKAVGRALAMLGYGTQFAPELEEGERIVDSPVERKPATVERKTPEEARKQGRLNQISDVMQSLQMTQERFNRAWAAVAQAGMVPKAHWKDLSDDDFANLLNAIVANFQPEEGAA